MQFLVGMWIVALGCTVVLSAPADKSSAAQVPDAPAADVVLAPEAVKSTDVSDENSVKSSNDFSAFEPTIVLMPDGKLRAELPELSLKSDVLKNNPKSVEIVSQLIGSLLKIPLTVLRAVTEAVFAKLPTTQTTGQVVVTQTSPAAAKA